MKKSDDLKSVTKITYKGKSYAGTTIGNLKPLEFAIIEEPGTYEGHIVMRTASVISFEVIDLTQMTPEVCWTSPGVYLKCRRLKAVEISITLED